MRDKNETNNTRKAHPAFELFSKLRGLFPYVKIVERFRLPFSAPAQSSLDSPTIKMADTETAPAVDPTETQPTVCEGRKGLIT